MGVTCTELLKLSYVSPTTVYSFGILDQIQKWKKAQFRPKNDEPDVFEDAERDERVPSPDKFWK